MTVVSRFHSLSKKYIGSDF